MQVCVAFLHNKLMNLCTLICSLQAINAQSEMYNGRKREEGLHIGHWLFLSVICLIYV